MILEVAFLTAILLGLARTTRCKAVLALTLVAFAGRLLIGESLYLVSALNLPVLASLHIAGGFWQLAPDAAGYDLAARQIMGLADPAGLIPAEAEDPFILSVVGLYRVFGTNPSPVLALNAALAAACVPLLYMAAQDAGLSSRMALLTAGVAGLWPSSLAWSGQMLKDAMAWFGLCAALAGTGALLRPEPLKGWRAVLGPAALVVVGEVTLVLIRRYAAEVLVVATLTAVVLVLIRHRARLRPRLLPSGVLVVALAAGAVPMRGTVAGVAQTMSSELTAGVHAMEVRVRMGMRGGASRLAEVASAITGRFGAPPVTIPLPPALQEPVNGQGPAPALAVPSLAPSVQAPPPAEGPPNRPGACRPASMLLSIRNGFDNTGGASLVDTSVRFRGCLDVLAYAPRALELSYLEPSPLQWVRTGQTTGPARHLAALDAILLWLLLPGVAAGTIHLARRPHAFQLLVLVYAVLVGFALGLAVTNFGTLFRLRLQGILPAVILAADGWMLIAGWLQRLRPAPGSSSAGEVLGLEAGTRRSSA